MPVICATTFFSNFNQKLALHQLKAHSIEDPIRWLAPRTIVQALAQGPKHWHMFGRTAPICGPVARARALENPPKQETKKPEIVRHIYW